jgi:chitinase
MFNNVSKRNLAISIIFLLLVMILPLQAFAATEWQPNVAYKVGDLVTYKGSTYKCLQNHTSLTGWEPPNTTALWQWVSSNPDDTEVPTAPSDLTVVGKTDTTVTLSWKAAMDNVGVDKYQVFNGSSQVGFTQSTTYTVSGLKANTSYTFTVKAQDAAGNLSPASQELTVTTNPTDGGGTNPGTGKKLLIGYWHNFDNGSTNIRLRDVSKSFDVIQVAFGEPSGKAPGEIGFTPYNATPEEFKADIAYLQAQGKKVQLSLGGANGHIQLNDETSKQNFINSLIKIIETYNFDGIDIDLEGSSLSLNAGDTDFKNPTTPAIKNMIAAIRTICDKFGSNFQLTMAPETAYVQGGQIAYGGPWGAYLPVIHALRDKLTFIHDQHYNTGSMQAIDGKTYNQGTADFQVAMAEVLLQGFPIAGNQNNQFPALREDQVAIGLPATKSAAPSGGYTTPQDIDKALNYLVKGKSFGGSYQLRKPEGYTGFKGIMTWSINWDATSNFGFSSPVRQTLDQLK